MKQGKIVVIAGQEIGVVVTPGETTSKVMTYYPKSGRWGGPHDTDNTQLAEPPEDHATAKKALANIRRHFGLIPYGGIGGQYARVWGQGKEP